MIFGLLKYIFPFWQIFYKISANFFDSDLSDEEKRGIKVMMLGIKNDYLNVMSRYKSNKDVNYEDLTEFKNSQ